MLYPIETFFSLRTILSILPSMRTKKEFAISPNEFIIRLASYVLYLIKKLISRKISVKLLP